MTGPKGSGTGSLRLPCAFIIVYMSPLDTESPEPAKKKRTGISRQNRAHPARTDIFFNQTLFTPQFYK
jgi:hypothetical protein